MLVFIGQISELLTLKIYLFDLGRRVHISLHISISSVILLNDVVMEGLWIAY
jgi:hypothetical protein